MIRWMLLMFMVLVLVNSATGWVRKIGLGRLPGMSPCVCWDVRFFCPAPVRCC
jgi:hypothetical protein